MNLTRNFSLLELTKSDTAIRRGLDNNPNADQVEKLKALCENILQPVRDHFGRVTVTSCFRSPQLCQKINSSINSQHTKAEAVDFEVIGTSNAEVFDWIKENLDTGRRIITADKPQGSNLIDVTIFHLDKNYNLKEKIFSKSADIQDNNWVLSKVEIFAYSCCHQIGSI